MLRLTTHVPGGGAGDNVNFLWNFWWMREALESPARFFFTTALFAPYGADLTLHTHTALNALAGGTVLSSASPIAALNLTILASLFLNGMCAYVLAWRLTRNAGASTIAGLIFAGSPYVTAHLNGHFNLTSAWTIPLFAMACIEAFGGPKRAALQPSTKWAVAAGLILGATAYIDYYYVIYQIAFAILAAALAAGDWSIEVRGPTARTERVARVFAGLVLLDVVIIAGILATGGFDTTVAGVRVLAREVFNPLQTLWVLLAIAVLLHWRPAVRVRRVDGPLARFAFVALAIIGLVFALVAAPIAMNALALLQRGDYVTQTYFWRSAPKGIDLATLLLGNPFHGLWGSAVQQSYRWLDVDVVEQGAWLGVVPIILAGLAVGRRGTSHDVRFWLTTGVVFFVWALGPHLMAFGANTGMILPQTLLRYIPLAANARLPGRAIVFVYLATAVLGSLAIAEWQKRSRDNLALAAIALLIVVDFIPAPFPLGAIDRPAIYETLRDRPEPGALLELPAGIRDGMFARGFLDHRVLAYQMIHGRPIVGGFVARLPPAIIAGYESDPLIAALLSLSERNGSPVGALPDRRQAGELLAKNGITFVMLNREHAPPALVEYTDPLPLVIVATEGQRTLYRVAETGYAK